MACVTTLGRSNSPTVFDGQSPCWCSYQLDKVPGRGRETTNKSHVGALRFPDPLNFYRGTWLMLMLSVPMWDSSSKILSIHRALAEKQALMVVAAAEAQKRMMETSTNGAKRGGCCNKCWNTATSLTWSNTCNKCCGETLSRTRIKTMLAAKAQKRGIET